MVRAQGIGTYGTVGENGRNGGHRSSGASNIINSEQIRRLRQIACRVSISPIPSRQGSRKD
jgi:hypothetical protein